MNKGLEALEELKTYLPAIYSEVAKCLKIIKQDLERKEQLEKENQTLNEALDFAKADYTTARINLDNASARIKELEKENQKLEKFIEWLKDDEGNLYIKPEMLDKLKELKLYKEK